MKKIVYSLLFIVLAFLLNIGLYFYSENYSFFLRQMKYGDELIEKDSQGITDEYVANTSKQCSCEDVKMLGCFQSQTGVITSTGMTQTPKVNLETFLSNFDKSTLQEKGYDEYYKIFDITDEYPSVYQTYTNPNYELYIFSDGKFEDLYNMFELLSQDQNMKIKFSINQVNNFGQKSFFINKQPDDGKVRLVIENAGILFGLNIKKSYYTTIKTILEKF